MEITLDYVLKIHTVAWNIGFIPTVSLEASQQSATSNFRDTPQICCLGVI
jgi:hypothetical protein